MTNLTVRQNGKRNAPARRGALDPFQPFLDTFWSFDRELEFLGGSKPRVEFSPSFDVVERSDAFILKADLPGVRSEDLEISVMEDQLNISGSRRAEEHHEGDSYYMHERSYGDFSRTFTLPSKIATDSIEASLENGELSVMIPKLPEAQPRKIPIGRRMSGGEGDSS